MIDLQTFTEIDFSELSDDELIALNAPIVEEWRKRYPLPPPPPQEQGTAFYRVLGEWMNVRVAPSIQGAISNMARQGSEIAMKQDTVKNDGYLWRKTVTGHWIAQETLSGLKYLERV